MAADAAAPFAASSCRNPCRTIPLLPTDGEFAFPCLAPDFQEMTMPALAGDQYKRYSRHLILPEIGMEGQQKLLDAKVLCIGAGGLGCPVTLYLAAAGVGTIGLVDFDEVDMSNLQRQVLFTTDDIGEFKAETAKKRLEALNPDITVNVYNEALTSDNALDIVREYDIVVDGTDNFPTRYLVNDACVLLGKPNVYGSIFRFDGQASVLCAPEGPCYRCLYPEPPPPGEVPSCAEGGVLGILPGFIGTIQATETVKLIVGGGRTLVGRLIQYNAMNMTMRELKLRKDPDCPMCGENRTINELIDYKEFCGVAGNEEDLQAMDEMNVNAADLKAMLESDDKISLLDVRNPNEAEICKIDPSTLVPLAELPYRVDEVQALIDDGQKLVVYCHHGTRSLRACQMLKQAGFENLKNLWGGVDQWAVQVEPDMPRY
jgi:molybdopterin/thiamine biosynthesis adenylyltransferase/rhodanese-related sulfurtransferase